MKCTLIQKCYCSKASCFCWMGGMFNISSSILPPILWIYQDKYFSCQCCSLCRDAFSHHTIVEFVLILAVWGTERPRWLHATTPLVCEPFQIKRHCKELQTCASFAAPTNQFRLNFFLQICCAYRKKNMKPQTVTVGNEWQWVEAVLLQEAPVF